MDRRTFIMIALAPLLPMLPASAHAQSYPTKPVRFVIGFPAGGPNDILGRIAAQWLAEKLGQPFNVENKGGQSGNIATARSCARRRMDTPSCCAAPPTPSAARSIRICSFNFLRDIVPVAGVTREPLVMVVHPSVPAKTVPEFLAHAKANARRRSRWPRPETAARRMSPANCSSRWPGLRSTSCTMAAADRR